MLETVFFNQTFPTAYECRKDPAVTPTHTLSARAGCAVLNATWGCAANNTEQDHYVVEWVEANLTQNVFIDSNRYQVLSPIDSIRVSGISTYATVVGEKPDAWVNVTVENQNSQTELANVSVYAGTVLVGTLMNIAISNQSLMTLSFTWNTTDFTYGNYTLNACASAHMADNNFTGGWVIVSIVGDITGPNGWPDGQVNMRDIAIIARCFGSTPSSSNWNPNADLNGDGAVNMRDIALVARHFGQHYP